MDDKALIAELMRQGAEALTMLEVILGESGMEGSPMMRGVNETGADLLMAQGTDALLNQMRMPDWLRGRVQGFVGTGEAAG